MLLNRPLGVNALPPPATLDATVDLLRRYVVIDETSFAKVAIVRRYVILE